MDESSLIQRCKRGDSHAQHQVYERYAEVMMPVCIRYVRDMHEAEDVLVQGFFKFFRSMAGFEYRGEGSVRAVLQKIMVNECLMHLRKANRLVTLDAAISTDEESGEDVFGGLNAKDIFKAIAALPDGYRTVFNLYEVEGYTHREIAAALRISEGTSKSQLSKAKGMLRLSLQQNHGYYARR